MATLEPARARLRRLRSRLLRGELQRLEEADRRLAAELDSRLGGLDSRIDIVSEQAGMARWWSGPKIWNDLGRDPSPPLPSPAELVGPGDLERALAAQSKTVQRERLERLGIAELDREARADRRPLPAAEDRERYFEHDDLAYWLSGLGDALVIEELAGGAGRPLGPGAAFCDLGCSTGRVVRQIARRNPGTALYGIDIQPQAVRWVRDHLGPEVFAALGTVVPALPFADGAIDVLFAGSVFTHIDEFEEGWLLEVRRVLRPGGVALLTFHPDRVWGEMRDDPGHHLLRLLTATPTRVEGLGVEVSERVFERPVPGPRVVFRATEYPINNVNLLHSHEWVRERWGRVLPVERIIERAHGAWQDMAVLRKPE